jgi:O-antigen/teichoic acid export membrane protein
LIGFISFPTLISGAFLGGLEGVTWAFVFNLSLHCILNHFALLGQIKRFNIPLSFRRCISEYRVLFNFSLPAALSGALIAPVNWVCSALLVNQPAGYEEMGVFNAANQWRLALLFLPGLLSQAILPLLSNLSGESTEYQYKKVLLLNLFLNISISFIILIPLLLFSKYIMLAYGAEFVKGTIVLRILIISAILTAANNVVGQAIVSRGKMWIGFSFNALWATTLLSIAIFLVKHNYGALGIAYATLISYAMHTIWQSGYLFSVLRK